MSILEIVSLLLIFCMVIYYSYQWIVDSACEVVVPEEKTETIDPNLPSKKRLTCGTRKISDNCSTIILTEEGKEALKTGVKEI